jgi:acyl-coenzyme A synthetase/AMP-(fatty) acid ligase
VRVVDMIFFWARTTPHRIAVLQSSMILTYRALAEGIESIGDRIEQLEFDKQQPVGVSILNPGIALATIFALLRAGYNVAPVGNRRMPFLSGAGVRQLIYDVEGMMTSGGRNVRFDSSWLPAETRKLDYRRRTPDGAAVSFFTSGTTGLPKKVFIPSASLDAQLAYPFTCGIGAYQKIMILVPPSIYLGFTRACEVLYLGKTAGFSLVDSALRMINLFRFEAMVAPPPMALALVEARKSHPGYDVNSLKAVFVGGGKIDKVGIAQIRSFLCRNVINVYGSTEGGTVALIPFDIVGDGTAMMNFPWTEMEVVDRAGRQVPANSEGQIRIRSPQLRENIKASDATADLSVQDGWFYPGDRGFIGNDGAFYLTDRESDVINRGGIKVSGTRIAELIEELPGIKEAAACSISGESGVEELWIAIVPNGPYDVENIKSYLVQHPDIRLAPDEVVTLDELPRGEAGKAQKLILKEMLLARKKRETRSP